MTWGKLFQENGLGIQQGIQNFSTVASVSMTVLFRTDMNRNCGQFYLRTGQIIKIFPQARFGCPKFFQRNWSFLVLKDAPFSQTDQIFSRVLIHGGRWNNRNLFSALSQTSSWEENNQFRIWRECSKGASSGMIEVIDLTDESFPNFWNKCSSLTNPWRQALPSNISAVWFNSFFIGTFSKLFYRNRTGRLPGNFRENLPAGGRHPPL